MSQNSSFLACSKQFLLAVKRLNHCTKTEVNKSKFLHQRHIPNIYIYIFSEGRKKANRQPCFSCKMKYDAQHMGFSFASWSYLPSSLRFTLSPCIHRPCVSLLKAKSRSPGHPDIKAVRPSYSKLHGNRHGGDGLASVCWSTDWVSSGIFVMLNNEILLSLGPYLDTWTRLLTRSTAQSTASQGNKNQN